MYGGNSLFVSLLFFSLLKKRIWSFLKKKNSFLCVCNPATMPWFFLGGKKSNKAGQVVVMEKPIWHHALPMQVAQIYFFKLCSIDQCDTAKCRLDACEEIGQGELDAFSQKP